MSIVLISVLAGIFALGAAVLAFIFIIPANKREKLNAFGKALHDICNFKFLVLERILKFAYVLSTAYSILYGFFMLFSIETRYGSYNYYTGTYETEVVWNGYWGFVIMILGPIVIRIVYEFILMLILAVNNIIEINNKMSGKNEKKTVVEADKVEEIATITVPTVESAPVVNANDVKFCTVCGCQLDANKKCTNCFKQF